MPCNFILFSCSMLYAGPLKIVFISSFEQWVPLRDHSLGACHGLIPVILLLMTAGLFAKANLSNIFSLSSPLRHAVKSENHRDAGQLLIRHSEHKHLIEFSINDVFLERGSAHSQNLVVIADQFHFDGDVLRLGVAQKPEIAGFDNFSDQFPRQRAVLQ